MRSRLKFPASLILLFLVALLPGRISAQDESQGALKPSTDVGAGASPATDSTLTPTANPGSDYVIGEEDVLRMSVFNVPNLDATVRVADDGTITLPLLGQVKAAGLTALQLEKELEADYGKTYLQNPQISIFVQEFQAQPVSVVGAVDRPGIYYMKGPRRLIDLISMAGGLAKRNTDVPGKSVFVTRPGGFEDVLPQDGLKIVSMDKVEIDLKKLLYSGDTQLNIPIKPRDVIAVSKAEVIYVMGAVQKPNFFVLQDRNSVTALQALAMAGGFGPNAKRQSGRIIRVTPDGKHIEIPINLKNVVDNRAPDPMLLADDILYVPDSTGKAAIKRGIDAALATVSGILIYHP